MSPAGTRMPHDAVRTRTHDGVTAISLNVDMGREEGIDEHRPDAKHVGDEDHAKRDDLDVIGQIGRPAETLVHASDDPRDQRTADRGHWEEDPVPRLDIFPLVSLCTLPRHVRVLDDHEGAAELEDKQDHSV